MAKIQNTYYCIGYFILNGVFDCFTKCIGFIFVSLGYIKTEGLVTEESVKRYIFERKELKNKLGKIPKKNREVKAYFEDDSYTNFMSIDAACLFFGISRDKIMRSIEKKKFIKVKNELIKFV